MAGIIQQQMAQPQPPAAPEDPMMQGMPPGIDDDEASEAQADPDDNPAFQQAAQYVMEALYSAKAAKDVAKTLRASRSVSEGLANVAYEITSIVDERTQGQVPDELLVPLAAMVLEEVGDIAEAAGLTVSASDVAEALKQMILRFLGEQGVDTSQLEQAMNNVGPEEFERLSAQEV